MFFATIAAIMRLIRAAIVFLDHTAVNMLMRSPISGFCWRRKEMSSNGAVNGCAKNMSLSSSSYEAAMEALSSLNTGRKRGDGSSTTGYKFSSIYKHLEILGLEGHLSSLKIIHVAGTKGKGSTCTFTESILRQYGYRTGLFTSPHLVDVRERYRINGLDISEERFLLYFWDCWNQLKAKVGNDVQMPILFQFFTLLAFKIFLSEKVDVAIIEVGIGGRLDPTNVITDPIVCGVTSLGLDHTEILGNTIELIASEKAGISKPNVPAFTVPQPSEAMYVLMERASELKIPLKIASPLSPKLLNGVNLGLAGDHQFSNAGLAIELCKCWLQRTGHQDFLSNSDMKSSLPDAFIRGLSSASLLGRAQIVHANHEESSNLIFYLDGAHTAESMEVCANWFSNAVKSDQLPVKHENSFCDGVNKIPSRILLFNCMEVRDPRVLLPQLVNTCASNGVHFSKALFVPSMSSYNIVGSGASAVPSDVCQDTSWQATIQVTWENIVHGKDENTSNCQKNQNFENLFSNTLHGEDPHKKYNYLVENCATSAVIASLPLAIKLLREWAKDNPSLIFQVLVTGSLHLVGDVLKIIGT